MADLNLPQKNGGHHKTQAPRIDLTPMVDLGFLLITFFMFTTTLANENALPLHMPDNAVTKEPTVLPEESTLTLIPMKAHKVAWYAGAMKDPGQLKSCATNQVMGIVLNKGKEVAALPASYSKEAHKLHVIIKPTDDCNYEDVVQVLDVMLIMQVPYYTIVDISAEEKEMIGSNTK